MCQNCLSDYRAAKSVTPFSRNHRYAKTDKNRFATTKQLIYPQNPNIHPGRSINPANNSAIYIKPPNKVIMTGAPCLIGMISLVHVRTGILTPSNRPISVISQTYETAKSKIINNCDKCIG